MTFTHIPVSAPKLEKETSATGKRFYITPNGDQYPSVTTILGAKEKPWLENWKKMLGDEKAEKEKNRAAERGTAIHDMTERYLKNEDPETFRSLYSNDLVKGFNQIKPYLNRIDNINAQEVTLYSDTLKAAGTVDLVGEYQGTLSIVDFKTANNNRTEDQIEDYYLQATAYAIMWHEQTGIPVEDITIIMSVQKGLVPLIFTSTIDKYIKQLLQRIDQYHHGAS